MPKRKNKIAIVEWWDAYSGLAEVNPSKTDKGAFVITVGHLVERTKHGIRVAAIRDSAHPPQFDSPFYRAETFIPKGMIHKVTIRRI